MRILNLARDLPYFPGGHGGNTRTFCLIRELSHRHRFTVVTNVRTRPQEEAAQALRAHTERLEYYRDPAIDTAPAAPDAPGGPLPRWHLAVNELRSYPGRFLLKLRHYVAGQLRGFPSEVRLWEAAFENVRPAIGRVLESGPYDILQIECSDNARWAKHVPFSGPKILVVNDVKTVVWWRRFKSAPRVGDRFRALNEALRFYFFERRYSKFFDHLVAMSEQDRAALQRLTGHPRISVVPNGVDVSHFSPSPHVPDPLRIVFTATMNHPPNTDGILHFARAIWPLIRAAEPAATLDIVGSDPPPLVRALAGPHVRVTGYVPDTRPYIAAASVFICPLRFASGTRLKILEAMAMAKPVVSTSFGAEGIECTPGSDILLADEPGDFAQKVIDVLRNAELRQRIGYAARALAERYSWPRIAERLDAVYAELHRSHVARRATEPLRIGLSGLFLVPGGSTGGLEPYFRNLLANILRLDHESRYVLVANPSNVHEFDTLRADNLERHVAPATPSVRQVFANMVRASAARALGVPFLPVGLTSNGVVALNLDLVHSIPGYIDPYVWRVPSVLTIADIQHEFYPEFFDAQELAARRSFYGPSAQRAVRIIAISEFTRRSLIERFGVAADKVSVIPLGVDPRFFAPVSDEDVIRVRRQYRIPETYCIYSANLWPHKNHIRLLAALASLDSVRRPHLVLTGSPTRTRIQLREEIRSRGLEAWVSWLGYVPAGDLPPLFAGARFMVFPSLFEGFGMPVVEAMAAGCPVACANATALPEVVGDAALLFDPLSSDAIAAAIDRLWHDAEPRVQLGAAGRMRARQFTWRRTALRTVQLYRETAARLRGLPV